MADGSGELLLIRREAFDRPTRLRVSIDDIFRWQRAGLVDPDADFELIDGEIIYMPAEGERHLNYKIELVRFFNRTLSDTRRLTPDGTLMLSTYNAPEPDLYVFEAGAPTHPIDVSRLHLVVEIADTSLVHDLVDKAPLYASFGVVEYWVVDVGARLTHVFCRPRDGRYGKPQEVAFSDWLRPLNIDEISLRIDDLPYVRLG